jgi:hypothetical protein
MQKKYSLFKTIASFFISLCIAFIPFPFHLLKIQESVTDFLFGKLIGVTARLLFNINLKSTLVHSDAVSMYILVLLLFFLAVLLTFAMQFWPNWKTYRHQFFYFIYSLACYYLILMLMKYGMDKIFKGQFYLPEPNTLYTPLGQMDKDLLYWTSMGTSHFYNVFLGFVEVLAAILLLFKGTRMAGAILATAAMVQVVMINFGFDISVKLYSLFLLFISFYLVYPYLRRLYTFFFTTKETKLPIQHRKPFTGTHLFIAVFIKCLVVGLILFESVCQNVRTNNFNDDRAKRPYLHGAYQVLSIVSGRDTLIKENWPVKRFFIHRNGYLIFQNQQDAMQDYKFDFDAQKNTFSLTDYQLNKKELVVAYQPGDSLLTLEYQQGGKQVRMAGKALDWKKLPALHKSFHWTVD